MLDLRLYRYQLPMTLANLSKREGLVFSYRKDGEELWQEISPLPKWSHESLDDVLRHWHAVKDNLSSLPFEEMQKLPSSLAFALQSISLFSSYDPSPISVCGHLMGSASQMAKDAETLLAQGCKTIKIKVSNLNDFDATALLCDLASIFTLRIDTNQTWNLAKAKKILSNIPIEKIDYIEEPFADPEDLQSFPFPFALDEMLRKSFPPSLETLPHFKTIVIKPTMQGVFDETSLLFQMARKRNFEIVLSSSFESSIGIYQIARLAKHLKLKAPMGIGTFRYFSDDLLETPLRIENGHIIFPTQMKPKCSYLTPI